jgi:hypothetical protein
MFKTLVLALIMLSSVKAFHAPLRRVAKNGVRSAQMVLIPFDRPTATAPLANMMDLIENMGGLEGFLPAVTRTTRTPNMQMDVKVPYIARVPSTVCQFAYSRTVCHLLTLIFPR